MAQCPACQRQFFCGVTAHSAAPCWCQALPSLNAPSVPSQAAAPTTCYCPACLQHLLTLQQREVK